MVFAARDVATGFRLVCLVIDIIAITNLTTQLSVIDHPLSSIQYTIACVYFLAKAQLALSAGIFLPGSEPGQDEINSHQSNRRI